MTYKAIIFFYEARPFGSAFSFLQYAYSWLKLKHRPWFQHVAIAFVHNQLPPEFVLTYGCQMPFRDATALSLAFEVLESMPMGEALKDCTDYIMLEAEYEYEHVQAILSKAEAVLSNWQEPISWADLLRKRKTITWCTDFVLQCLNQNSSNSLLPDQLYRLLEEQEQIYEWQD